MCVAGQLSALGSAALAGLTGSSVDPGSAAVAVRAPAPARPRGKVVQRTAAEGHCGAAAGTAAAVWVGRLPKCSDCICSGFGAEDS
jgi:hypothetical protein